MVEKRERGGGRTLRVVAWMNVCIRNARSPLSSLSFPFDLH